LPCGLAADAAAHREHADAGAAGIEIRQGWPETTARSR
jgi:hypothetical protein